MIIWEDIIFQFFLLVVGWLFGQMEEMGVAGVLQEAGDTESTASGTSHM